MKKLNFILLLSCFFLTACQEEDLLQRTSHGKEEKELKGDILWRNKSVEKTLQTKTVGVKSKYWRPGDTIRIKFLNGTTELQQQVRQYAALWLEYVDLNFEYVEVNETADVKIGFDMDEKWIAWSTIGTDCKAIPQNEPSLNFVWLEEEDELGIKAEVLRGFGSVLGLGFEHRNPDSPVRFKSTADIAGEYNISEEEVEEFKQLYTEGETDTTRYDKSSIMVLTIPRSLVVTPNLATSRNVDLSENDKALIAKIYPPVVMKVLVKGKNIAFYVGASGWASVPGEHSERMVDWGDGKREYLLQDALLQQHYYGKDSLYEIRFCGPAAEYQLFYFIGEGDVVAVDASKSSKLATFYCFYSSVESLDFSHNPELQILSLRHVPQLTYLNVSQNVKLQTLEFSESNISTVDLSRNVNLENLILSDSPISYLDLKNNTKLVFINAENVGAGLKSIVDNLPYVPVEAEADIWVRVEAIANSIQDKCRFKNWEAIFEKENKNVLGRERIVQKNSLNYMLPLPR